MAGVGGAAVPGRLSLAGTEARPTELFSYKRSFHLTGTMKHENMGQPASAVLKGIMAGSASPTDWLLARQ